MTERCPECGVAWEGPVPKHVMTCSRHEPADDIDRIACAMLAAAFEDQPRLTGDRVLNPAGIEHLNFTALAKIAVREMET